MATDDNGRRLSNGHHGWLPVIPAHRKVSELCHLRLDHKLVSAVCRRARCNACQGPIDLDLYGLVLGAIVRQSLIERLIFEPVTPEPGTTEVPSSCGGQYRTGCFQGHVPAHQPLDASQVLHAVMLEQEEHWTSLSAIGFPIQLFKPTHQPCTRSVSTECVVHELNKNSDSDESRCTRTWIKLFQMTTLFLCPNQIMQLLTSHKWIDHIRNEH
eukprot:2366864-Amphidinium_carterae.1